MDRVFRIGVLNIVTQPHSPARYQELFLKVRNRRKAGRVRGDRFGMIALMQKTESPKASGSYVQGLIGTFTQIDENSNWINVTTGKKAEGDELSQINIPKDLRPNLAYNRFRFYLNEHLLMFEIGNSGAKLTPSNAEKLFKMLFSPGPIVNEYGEVAVTIWPDSDTINLILNNTSLRSIHLVVHAPNSDDGKQAEERFMKRLESMNVRKIEQNVIAKKDEVIKPDHDLIEVATIASTNGRVDAMVSRNGRTVKLSTQDTPFIQTHTYSTDSNTEEKEFGIACEKIRHQLRKKK